MYFLMFGGWKEELRSNRWHFATRWARHLPVILVQPSQVTAPKSLRTEVESRIPNTRILHVQSSDDLSVTYADDTMVQVGQVIEDMRQHRIERPLLWCYNPAMAGLYAALPATARVLHATENYFHFDGVSELFLDLHRLAIRISDLVVAVSDGVAASIRSNVPAARVEVITNGCDYETYSRWSPHPTLVLERRRGWDRIAVYAGNINNRLDFGILTSSARAYRQTLFALFGPVHGLSVDDLADWRRLLKEPNVRYFGLVTADELPDLYGAADIGMIPYKRTPLLVENGFPLKALEMCATGLPVVATLMKPIQGLCDALLVATDHDEFLAALGALARQSLSEAQQAGMRRVCRDHDYDRNFEVMIEALDKRLARTRPLGSRRLDDVIARVQRVYAEHGANAWRSRARTSRWLLSPFRRLNGSRIAKAAASIRVVSQDPGARRILRIALRHAAAARQAGIVRLMKDMLRLGLLGCEATYATEISGALRVARRYDAARQRLVFRTVCRDAPQSASPIDGFDLPLATNGGEIEEIIWDHSEAGQTVSLVGGMTRWSVFLGRDGVYEFSGVKSLLRRHPEAVSNALGRIGTGVATPLKRRRLSASIDIQRGIEERNRAFVHDLGHVASGRQADVDTVGDVMSIQLDRAYRRRYPDLLRYVPVTDLRGRPVLQLGLGAGAVGQALLASGCRYAGVDPVEGLVQLMRARVRQHEYRWAAVVHASPLEIPFAAGTFDYVFFLDILSEQRDLGRVVGEIHRVLVDGGRATVVTAVTSTTSRRRARRDLMAMLGAFKKVTVERDGDDAYVTVRR